MGKLAILALTLFILLASIASAATISGTIYDMSLNRVSNVIVEVSSKPVQRVLSTDGKYSFSLEPGTYIIMARAIRNNVTELISEENIDVRGDGTFVHDLFLFPNTRDEELLFNSSNIDLEAGEIEDVSETNYLNYAVPILVILALAALAFFALRKKQKPVEKEDADLNKVIQIIKKQGGRATQKDIRKEIPLSEAKISLMIAELESKGIVEKIKKGRGNIIILKK